MDILILDCDYLDPQGEHCGRAATHAIRSGSWAETYGSCDEHLATWGAAGDTIVATPLADTTVEGA